MKMNLLKKLFYPLLALIVVSCGNVIDSDKNILKTPKPDEDVFASKYFVNTPESYWKYIVHDTSSTTYDTLEVSIVSNEFYPILNTFASKWSYKFKYHPEENYTRYVALIDSSVYEYNSVEDTTRIMLIKFPLTEDSKWYVGHTWDTFTPKIDTAKVLSAVSKNLNGVDYQSYVIYRAQQIHSGLYWGEFIQFIPNIGIIYDNSAPGYAVTRTYELYEYQLK